MTEPQDPGHPDSPQPDPSDAPASGGFDPTFSFGPPGHTPGQQWQPSPPPSGLPPSGPPPSGAQLPSRPFPAPPGPGEFGPGQFTSGQPIPGPPPFPPGNAAPKPSFLSRLPLPYKLTLASVPFGVVTFFMGFLGWLTIDSNIERDADVWAADLGDSLDVPAFFSPSLILSPGWFFILLGTVAVGTIGLVAAKWRRFLPYLAFLAVGGWLALFACAMGLPVFIGFGAGAYVALIFGFIQAALLAVATLLDGLNDDRVAERGQHPPA